MNHYPADLAEIVFEKLPVRDIRNFDMDVLSDLLETAYFASLCTEEAQPISCTLTFIDPESPDPGPLRKLDPDHWRCVELDDPIPLNVNNLVKLARAADQASSHLAVFHGDGNELFIWGMIDQANRYRSYLDLETDAGADVPGYFNVVISGIGSILVYKNYTLVGSIRRNIIARRGYNVMEIGPIGNIFQTSILDYINDVRSSLGEAIFDKRKHWRNTLGWNWTSSLRRILINIQAHHKGGSLLIIPHGEPQPYKDLNIKYGIRYDRLSEALNGLAEASIMRSDADEEIHSQYLPTDRKHMPVLLHLDIVLEGAHEAHRQSELTGCIRFISALSRVDGLVLLDGKLCVRGFGVEINSDEYLDNVYLAGDTNGSEQFLSKLDFNHFGTRHRSMMRFCQKNPGSVGFVVSQDDDIRAVTREGERLIVWENIEVQLT
ncbi:MAG: hypothetical protein H7338_04650 [Candidatus Sericytochromatia bacterium]|nr:hypothetical protein [Candidatus Sericytochromatia bacterium]